MGSPLRRAAVRLVPRSLSDKRDGPPTDAASSSHSGCEAVKGTVLAFPVHLGVRGEGTVTDERQAELP